MKGKVRRGKPDVAKERFVAVLIGMLLEDLDGVVGDSCRTIEAGARFDRRELLVVEVVDLGIEETALILEQVGAIESVFKRLTVDMPFAGVIGSIADRRKEAWGQHCPVLAPRPVSAGGNVGEFVASNLLSVESGEEGAPGRPAAGRVVELGESQAVFRHGIEMRCLNFTAVATEVGIAQVISCLLYTSPSPRDEL